MSKRSLRNTIIGGCMLSCLSAPAAAFFNPFGMMGSMMGQMAAPVTGQMIGQMLGAMQGLMHSNQFRNDVAQFALGTVDEAIFEAMMSLEGGEPTFVGALAETVLSGGAPRGSVEYEMAMDHWMGVFGPAIAARLEREQEVEAMIEQEQLAQAADPEPTAQELRSAELDRRFELGVYIQNGDYNWDTHSFEPNRLVYRDDNGDVVDYEAGYELFGDPV